MTGRDRTQSEHDACGLPTRTIRVSRGRVVWWVEVGSGRMSQMQLTLPDEEEWRRIMEAREAVRV